MSPLLALNFLTALVPGATFRADDVLAPVPVADADADAEE